MFRFTDAVCLGCRGRLRLNKTSEKMLQSGLLRLKDLHGEHCVNKKRASKGSGCVESVICIYIQGHCCLCLGCVQQIFQVTVCAVKHRKISNMTHFSTNAAAYCTMGSAKRADCTLLLPLFFFY